MISLFYLLDGVILHYVTPFCHASQDFSASLKITEPLCSLILHHDPYSEVKPIQLSQKSSVQSLKQEYYSKCSTDLYQHLDSSLRLALDLAVEKGASTWLTALPLMNMDLHYINLPFKMSLPCVMVASASSSHTLCLCNIFFC